LSKKKHRNKTSNPLSPSAKSVLTNYRNLKIALGAACVLVTGIISYNLMPHDEFVFIGKGINRPLREVPSLVVNTSLAYRNVTHKDEEAGVYDLHQLLKFSALEEEYFYLPKEKTWYETGTHEKADTSNNFVEGQCISDPTGLENILVKQPQIIDYHFHPLNPELTRKDAEDLVNQLGSIIPQEQYDLAVRKFMQFDYIIFGAPSTVDIKKIIRNRVENADTPEDEYVFQYKVTGLYGTFSYKVNANAVQYFVQGGQPCQSVRQMSGHQSLPCVHEFPVI